MSGLRRLRIALSLSVFLFPMGRALAVDWDLATANAPGNYQTKLDEKFASEVAAATHGVVKIAVHSGGQLGFKGPEMLGVIRDGLVPIGSFQLAQQVGLAPLLGTSSVAYLVSGFGEMKTFRDISRPYFDAEFKRFGQKLLIVIPWPPQNLFSKAEITSPASFQAMKIRTTDRGSSDYFRSLGASPAQIPWGEVVPALATGVIDSVSTSTSSAIDGQFWEFIKYCTLVNWQTNFEVISVNLNAWDSLSAEDRQAIEGLASKLEPEFWDVAKGEDSRNIETLKSHGMQIVEPAAAVRDAMVVKGKLAWAAFQEAVPASKPIIDKYLAAVGK